MTTRFEAEPFGTQGLFHIVRNNSKGKAYLVYHFSRNRVAVYRPSMAQVIVDSLSHENFFPENRWKVQETVYQGGHQYPSMLAATIAK